MHPSVNEPCMCWVISRVRVALVVPVKMAVRYVSRMRSPTSDPRAEVAAAVDEYQVHGNPMHLRVRLKEIADSAMPDALIAAVEPYREIPEVAIPVYEQVVADQPSNARALVTSRYDWSIAATHLEQAILATTTPTPAASPGTVTPITDAQTL